MIFTWVICIAISLIIAMMVKEYSSNGIAIVTFLILLSSAIAYFAFINPARNPPTRKWAKQPSPPASPTEPTASPADGNLVMHWPPFPESLRRQLTPATHSASNIHPDDYAGAEACKDCHKKNYHDWSNHPHQRMNALANENNVVGDFSGDAKIEYKGGVGTFFRENGSYHMRYERDDLVRFYKINQTIGSRFFQYYVGQGIEGPEPKDHPYYQEDHVLPFGYWIDRKAWVPIVHVHAELPDDTRWEPLHSTSYPSAGLANDLSQISAPSTARGMTEDSGDPLSLRYATSCNSCHTTFPMADMFIRNRGLKSGQMQPPLYFRFSQYLADSHPELWDGSKHTDSIDPNDFLQLYRTMRHYEAPEKAVALGVTCEACHLGCKAHAEEKQTTPSFAANSPFLFVPTKHLPVEQGRTHDNVNWVCSRCHTGTRPTYAAGISTWNSTEFSDASRGACYSELTCVQCHNPHKATGKKWTKTPDQDDSSCLSCHKQFNDAVARQNHTHHPQGSSGDRCMNCHMPKINEGMQDVVRTHTIFSPTQKDMIEANHPNACNLCHLDEPIDWTLGHLKQWYGKDYVSAKLVESYPDRDKAVGLGWLKHDDEAVRLVAADALARDPGEWALPHLIDVLDDDYLMIRQFTQKGLEDRFDIKLDEEFGYWFYLTKKERQEPIREIREQFIEPQQ